VVSVKATKAHAAELGFNVVGIAPAVPSPRLDAYFDWINAGMHGGMGYMAREDRQARRRDLDVVLPGARSIIIVALDYHALHLSGATPDMLNDPSRGRIAAYAWGRDYHDVMTPRLEALAAWLRDSTGSAVRHKVYVDTGAILERSHGQQAGIGFIGKNTLLINPRGGSYFFLGEIITDAEFDSYDPAHRETMCGNCMRCQVACPTNAFPKPYVLDARRCISYLTIENKGWIDRNLRPQMGNWIYGCDVCQDVCPFSRFVIPTHEAVFVPTSIDRVAPRLVDLLAMDEIMFRERFDGSPVVRIGLDRLLRNACVAAGNWGSTDAIPGLATLLGHTNAQVRGHAAWALGRIGEEGRSVIRSRLADENDEVVKAEALLALDMAATL
jgi:epoxyqueuosine reductase